MALKREQLLSEILENDAGATLEPGAILAMSRGITFCPSQPLDVDKRHKDLNQLKRKVNLKIHWANHKSNYRSSLVSNVIKSDWLPPEILKESSELWQKFRNTATLGQATIQNIPRSAIESWNRLIHGERWYVLKADKGGKLVIWGREEYKREALRQLKDECTYAELSETEAITLYSELRTKKIEIVHILTDRGNITRSEGLRICRESCNIPSIYFLPKIHKAKRPDTNTFSGRPIIAAVGSMLKTLDQYLAHVTAPLIKEIPGSLIDTGALLRDLEKIQDLDSSTQLYSADVEALYPSIPWNEGIDSATEFYKFKYQRLLKIANDSNKLPPPRPDLFKYILKLILEYNIFHFQDAKWYRQLKGTAMGCSMSVFLANTFMYKRTKHLIEKPPNELVYFGRYIDDIIAIYKGSQTEFESLFKDRTVDENIKLTYVHGVKELDALDVRLRIESDGTISSRLYRKPTDGHQFLHWASAHPTSLKRSIPYAQLLRIRRNCTFDEDFEKEASILIARLRKRRYPERVLMTALERARLKQRQELLNTGKPKETTERLNLILDFVQSEQVQLRQATKDFWSELRINEAIGVQLKDILPEAQPRIAFRLGNPLGKKLGPIFKKGPAKKP